MAAYGEAFDPAKFGATPDPAWDPFKDGSAVEDKPFDPAALGCTLVPENPSATTSSSDMLKSIGLLAVIGIGILGLLALSIAVLKHFPMLVALIVSGACIARLGGVLGFVVGSICYALIMQKFSAPVDK